ncbi:hypothetical protein E1I18_02465 [Mycoplasmopsis mucosicanis]|uniref:Uncharacterized protein n=1 Tax=Mycoplasmopsis mucosicanis TaxID=458208 RepID=A0A507SN12_9BACT|nr:hypothetical protein [Mycoplasmopsis mucosicanis]TQC51424.1 hypothetical protein E1I18_02465 [Mycoplasmopsis mucosicanis]
MAKFEKDPLVCQERIQKRRELLIELYEENKQELANPTLVKEDTMSEKECQYADCLLSKSLIDDRQYRLSKKISLLSVIASVLLIVIFTLMALMIGSLGK